MIGTKIYKPIDDKIDEYSALATWCNETQKGTIVEHDDYYECVPIEEPTKEQLKENEIARLKNLLKQTDYKTLKWVDGALTEEEYAEVKAYRQELRNKINQLEK